MRDAYRNINYTGHPFVDAGLSALLVAAGVEQPEKLTPEALEPACKRLEEILLSDQSLGIGVEKTFARGPLFQIFPNSELVNPSNWKQGVEGVRAKFAAALEEDLTRARQCLDKVDGDEVCLACGNRRPSEAMVIMRKNKMPLLEGIVNYYPSFSLGQRICGLCALAVRFLPMSVMRVGRRGGLWFLHAQSPEIATIIAQEYGWRHLEHCIAANKALDFYSQWSTAGEEGTLLYLLFELLERFPTKLRVIYEEPLPTIGYVFFNRNQGGFARTIPIPNELLRFLARLFMCSSRAYQRFWRELLQVPETLKSKGRQERERFVASIARRIFSGDSLLGNCIQDDPPTLRGGWIGHRLYLEEVRGMAVSKLAMLERLGLSIAQSEDQKKLINNLRRATGSDLYTLLLSFIRQGWLSHEEFYQLTPPSGYEYIFEVRDVLLAVVYEYLNCQTKGEPFPKLSGETFMPSPDEILQRIQRIGQKLIENLPNVGAWMGRFRSARNPGSIRGTYLLAIQRGAMNWPDFVFLAPLSDVNHLFLMRDYLLAFLFDRAKEHLPRELEEEEKLEEASGV